MSVWYDELPVDLKGAYSIVGNQSRESLRKMVRALSLHSHGNTLEERQQLEAARVILKRTQR